jgi:hypothetical protein
MLIADGTTSFFNLFFQPHNGLIKEILLLTLQKYPKRTYKFFLQLHICYLPVPYTKKRTAMDLIRQKTDILNWHYLFW